MGCCRGNSAEHMGPVGSLDGAETTKIKTAGMSCQHCVMAVKKRVGNLAGVKSVDVDLAAGMVTVTHEAGKSDREAIRQAIREAGYEPQD